MEENLYRKNFSVNAADCDMFGRLRPASMLKLMQGVGWEQLDSWGLGNNIVWDQGLLWIIGRTVVEINRLPASDESVEMRTWPGKIRRVFLPRSFELRDAAGSVLIRAKSIYLLMDKESRHAVTPQSAGLELPQSFEPGELPDPPSRVLFPAELPGACSRSARYSELDLNGHLNNTHYLSWGEDLLSVDYHRSHALRSLWVEYRKEVRPEDEVELRYTLADDTLYVKGGDYFAMTLGYGEPSQSR